LNLQRNVASFSRPSLAMGEVIEDLSHEAANSKERSSNKLRLGGNDLVGSFRKSKEKLIGRRRSLPRKGGNGAASVVALSAGVAPNAPAVSGGEQAGISLSGWSSGDHKTDQASPLVATPCTNSTDDEEPLPSLAIPAATLDVGPTATTALLPAEEGAASSGKPLLGGGSPPVEPATFELGEGASPGRLSGLSTAHVPVVEWNSLVGHRFLGSGESQQPHRTSPFPHRPHASPPICTFRPPHAPHTPTDTPAACPPATTPPRAPRALLRPGEFCTVSSATLDGKQVAVKVQPGASELELGLLLG